MVLQGYLKNENCYISATTRPMATQIGKVVTYYEKLYTHKVITPFKHVVTWGYMINLKHLHYHNVCGHQTWHDGYKEELPSLKSHDPFIMYSCNVACQIKCLISPPQWLRSPSMAGGCIQWGASFCKIIRFRDHVERSRDKLNTLYLYYRKACGH